MSSSAKRDEQLIPLRSELNSILERGRAIYAAKFDGIKPTKGTEMQQRIFTMSSKFWYRLAYIINCKLKPEPPVSQFTAEVIISLSALIECRQMICDLYEQAKKDNEKVTATATQNPITNHTLIAAQTETKISIKN